MSEVVAFPKPDTPPPPPEPNIGELIAIYIETRDAVARIEQQHKDHVKQYKDVIKLVEGKLMAHLQEHSTQSIASELGTAYLSHKRSASIADAIAFKNYVIESRAWDMLDWKPNVTAVGDFLSEHQTLPPGVNYKTVVTLGVQKK